MDYNLLDKAIKLFHQKNHKDNRDKIVNILLRNSYPLDFTYKYVKITLIKINNSTVKKPNTKLIFTVVPFFFESLQ